MPNITIQYDGSTEDTIDSWINGRTADQGTNYGSATTITIGYKQGGKGGDDFAARGIFRFDLGNEIQTSVATIITAKFSIKSQDVTTGGATQRVSRVLRSDWVEGQVTWDDYKTSTAWTTAGIGDTTNDYTTTNETTFASPTAAATWTDIQNSDMTAQVQKAVTDNISPNRSVHIRVKQDSETTPYNNVTYYSREWSVAANRPKLYVEYHRRVFIAWLPSYLDFIGIGLSWIIYRRMVLEKCEDGTVLYHGPKRKYGKCGSGFLSHILQYFQQLR